MTLFGYFTVNGSLRSDFSLFPLSKKAKNQHHMYIFKFGITSILCHEITWLVLGKFSKKMNPFLWQWLVSKLWQRELWFRSCFLFAVVVVVVFIFGRSGMERVALPTSWSASVAFWVSSIDSSSATRAFSANNSADSSDRRSCSLAWRAKRTQKITKFIHFSLIFWVSFSSWRSPSTVSSFESFFFLSYWICWSSSLGAIWFHPLWTESENHFIWGEIRMFSTIFFGFT